MSSRQKGPKSKPNSKPHGYELSTFSRNDIAAFAKSNASQLIKVLSNEIKRFQSTLEKTDICSIKFDIVIQILLKVSHGLTEENGDLCSKVWGDELEGLSSVSCRHVRGLLPPGFCLWPQLVLPSAGSGIDKY